VLRYKPHEIVLVTDGKSKEVPLLILIKDRSYFGHFFSVHFE